MRKIILFLAVLAAPAADQAQNGFVWRLQSAAGSKWELRSFVRMRLTEILPIPEAAQKAQHLPAKMKMEVGMVQKLTAGWDVVSKDGAGNLTIKLNYKSLDTDSKVVVNGKPAPAELQNMMRARLAGFSDDLAKVSLTIKLSPQSKVLDVQGTEQLTNLIMGRLTADHSPAAAAVGPFIKNMYSKENLQSLFSSSGEIPAARMEVGHGFSYGQEFPKSMSLPIKIYGTHILTKRENGLATFSDSANFEMTDAPFPLPMNLPLKMNFLLTGDLKGTTVVAEDTGVTRENNSTLRFQGKVTTSGKDLPEPMTIPIWMTIETHTVVEPGA